MNTTTIRPRNHFIFAALIMKFQRYLAIDLTYWRLKKIVRLLIASIIIML